MADHTEFVELALELISEEGRPITLKQMGTAPVDPDKPWKGNTAATSLSDTFGCFVPAAGSDLGEEWIDKELLKRCERVCLVPGTEVAAQADTIYDDGIEWKVEWVHALKPATQTIVVAFGVSR